MNRGRIYYRTDQVPIIGSAVKKAKDHVSVGDLCPVCGKEFQIGEYTCLIVLGPGDDPEARSRALHFLFYTAHAVEAHVLCTGRMEPEP